MLRNRSKKYKKRKYNSSKKIYKRTGTNKFGGWLENDLAQLYKEKPRKYKKSRNKKSITSQYIGQFGGAWGDNINDIKFNQLAGGWGRNDFKYNQYMEWDQPDINIQQGGWGGDPKYVNLGLIGGNKSKNYKGGWLLDLTSINNWNKQLE